MQEKKRKTLENKHYVEPIATEERYSYQTKAFSQTERDREFYEPLRNTRDTNRKREYNTQRRSFIKKKLKERFIYERETAKINRKAEKLSERLTKAVIHTAQAFVKSI